MVTFICKLTMIIYINLIKKLWCVCVFHLDVHTKTFITLKVSDSHYSLSSQV